MTECLSAIIFGWIGLGNQNKTNAAATLIGGALNFINVYIKLASNQGFQQGVFTGCLLNFYKL